MGRKGERENYSCVWWYISISPALGRLKQEDHHEFEAYLDPFSKPNQTTLPLTLSAHRHSLECGAGFLMS